MPVWTKTSPFFEVQNEIPHPHGACFSFLFLFLFLSLLSLSIFGLMLDSLGFPVVAHDVYIPAPDLKPIKTPFHNIGVISRIHLKCLIFILR